MDNRNTSWNAEVYDRIGTPMRGWAQQVIDDLGLRGDETVKAILGQRVIPRLTSPYRLVTIPATSKRVYVQWQGRP